MQQEDFISLVFRHIPRQGPGSIKSTRQAFELARPFLPPSPVIVDMGCGSGGQSLELARYLRPLPEQGKVYAIDSSPALLQSLHEKAQTEKLEKILEVKEADITNVPSLGLPPASCDLVWGEGSLYIAGFDKGINTWGKLLKNPQNGKPGGLLAITELSWLVENPQKTHPQAWDFWQRGYPPMRNVAENIAALQNSGYKLVGNFTLPENDWWENYYTPMQKRLDQLTPQLGPNSEAHAMLNSLQEEIELYRNHSSAYGYVFYIAARG